MSMKFRFIVLILSIFLSAKVSAQDEIIIVTPGESQVATLLTTHPQSLPDSMLLFPNVPANASHFTWGADLGSSFDLTEQGLTSFDLSACFGYRNRSIRFLGVGAGIYMMLNNSSRAYPVYAQLRTTFTSRQKFVFMEAKAGVSFISLYNTYTRRPLYGALGIGFTLASGRNFSSHIIIGYSFTPLRDMISVESNHPMRDLHQAYIRFGCAF